MKNTYAKRGVSLLISSETSSTGVRKGLWRSLISMLLGCALLPQVASGQSKVLFENNFNQSPAGKAPEEFMVVEGGFAVKEEGGAKFLELPAVPLGNYGALFGPAVGSNAVVSARIWGLNRGRRYPIFGVGLNGIGGYKLFVAPGRGNLEIHKGDAIVASTPFKWQPNAWTSFKFQTHMIKDGEFKLQGKVWQEGAQEPKEWMIVADEKALSPPGRASIWGCPIAETAIRFDDLLLKTPAE